MTHLLRKFWQTLLKSLRAGRDYLNAWLETLIMRRFLSTRRPFQTIIVGFLVYIVAGALLLLLPFATTTQTSFTDIVFTVTSAVSTTGLGTVSTGDTYTFFGEFVILCLFQLGGLGFMTLRSFLALAKRRSLAPDQERAWSAGFSLPQGLDAGRFIRHIVIFSLIIEVVGATLLYFEFRAFGMPDALWSAIFHSVSAFATAGFSLYGNGLEGFRGSSMVNITVGILCYLGAVGFIVIQDFYLRLRNRDHRISLTSKIILVVTAGIFLVQTPLMFFLEPSFRGLPVWERLMASGFQIMAASSTSGFNTVPIASLSSASLFLIIIAMVIGASPSGTGGGVRTTTVASLFAVLGGVLRGRTESTLLGSKLPATRIDSAVATTTLYLGSLLIGTFLLLLTEHQEFMALAFEAASAIGTVGLSMGITGNLTWEGKWIVIGLMYLGRVGPVTLGLALLHTGRHLTFRDSDDLAT